MKFLKSLFLLLIISGAANASDSQTFVNDTAKKAMDIVKSGQAESEKTAALTQLFVDSMDIEWIAKHVLGRSFLSLTDDQKQSYYKAYKAYLINAYVPLFKKYNGQEILIRSVNPLENNNFSVLTDIKSADKDISVEYRIAALDDGSFKIHDIVAEGVSLLQTQRSDFSSVISNKGFDELLSELKAKAQS